MAHLLHLWVVGVGMHIWSLCPPDKKESKQKLEAEDSVLEYLVTWLLCRVYKQIWCTLNYPTSVKLETRQISGGYCKTDPFIWRVSKSAGDYSKTDPFIWPAWSNLLYSVVLSVRNTRWEGCLAPSGNVMFIDLCIYRVLFSFAQITAISRFPFFCVRYVLFISCADWNWIPCTGENKYHDRFNWKFRRWGSATATT